MSAYRSMIDEALAAAQARVGTPAAEIQKTASAQDPLIKEAADLANALEFVSLSASGDGAVGSFRSEMVRDYYKQAAAGGPAESSTSTSGTQAQLPSSGKKKINPTGLVGGNSPKQTSASPAGKDGHKAMLESFKEAEGQSLYDILMANKEAAAGGPAEYCAESKGPLKNRLLGALGSNSAPVTAQKRQLKAPTRERLREAFSNVGDVTSDYSAQAIFPQAKSRGSLKVAEAELEDALDSFLEKFAGKKKQRRKRRAQVMNEQNALSAQSQMRRGRAAGEVSLPHDQSDINRKAQGRGGRVASPAKPASPLSTKVSPAGAARIQAADSMRQAGPTARDVKRQEFMKAREKRMGRTAARKRQRYEQKRSRKARLMERRQVRHRTQGVRGPTAPQPTLAQTMAPRNSMGEASKANIRKMPESAQKTVVPKGVPDSAVTRAGGTPVPEGQKRKSYTPAQMTERRNALNNQQRSAASARTRKPRGGGGGGGARAPKAPKGIRRYLTKRNLAIAGGALAAGGLGYAANEHRKKTASLMDFYEEAV